MNNTVIYSILQYRHSLILGELLNIGVLFYLPKKNQLVFENGDTTRVKSIYPEIDLHLVNAYIQNINSKVFDYNNRKLLDIKIDNLNELIHSHILHEDASALVFSPTYTTVNKRTNEYQFIKEYSHLLLVGLAAKKEQASKHNEAYISRIYTKYITSRDKKVFDSKIIKDKVLNNGTFQLKFDFAWQNGTLNLVKPLSFDLSSAHSILAKSAEYNSYLTWFKDDAKKNNCSFDFLIAEPQKRTLYKPYEEALQLIDNNDSVRKKLIEQKDWDKYCQKTLDILSEK